MGFRWCLLRLFVFLPVMYVVLAGAAFTGGELNDALGFWPSVVITVALGAIVFVFLLSGILWVICAGEWRGELREIWLMFKEDW